MIVITLLKIFRVKGFYSVSEKRKVYSHQSDEKHVGKFLKSIPTDC